MDKPLPELVERGINALKRRLGPDGASLLREVKKREQEFASFEFSLPVDFTGTERTLRIGFGSLFPRYGFDLKITPTAWLQWPHVMKDGVCLFGDRRPYSGTPESIVETEVSRLRLLIEAVLPTADPIERKKQFEREITNYWAQQLKTAGGQYVLLAAPDKHCELLALSDTRSSKTIPTTWLSADSRSLEVLERRLSLPRSKVRAPAHMGFYLPLKSYPDLHIPDPAQLVEWLAPHVESNVIPELQDWMQRTSSYPLRALVLKVPSGAVASTFMALMLRGSGVARRAVAAYGKRAGRRFASAAPTSHHPALEQNRLQVLDPGTVHSRNPETSRKLADVTVALVGVGSLGSIIAMALARSGVGRLILIDPDRFDDANLGRHVLGIEDLGRSKAEAMSERIRKDVPGVDTVAATEFVQVLPPLIDNELQKADLVIVSTADWDSEVHVWELKQAKDAWPLIQVWSEPYGVVGHALCSPKCSVDIGIDLFTENGEFRHAYTEGWPNGGEVQLPACGASYVPGGPVGLMGVAALALRVAIDVLLEPKDAGQWHALVQDSPEGIDELGGRYVGPTLPKGVEQQVIVSSWPSPGVPVTCREVA